MRTVLVLTYVTLFLVLSIPLMFVTWIMGKFNPDLKNKFSRAVIVHVFHVMLLLSGTKITVIGRENVPTDRAVLYIGNHRSDFDVLLLYEYFVGPTGFISKKEMLKVPLLATWMRNIGCLFLDRKNLKSGMQMMLDAVKKIQSGVSISIFPEGTRNTTAEPLLPMRNGSLKIAEKSGCPIVPVVLNNADSIFEAQMPWIKRAHVILEFGQPIYTDQLTKEEKKAIPQQLAAQITEIYLRNKALV